MTSHRNAAHPTPTAAPMPEMAPQALLSAIDEVAATLGAGDLRGEALAQAVAQVSARYTREREALDDTRDGAALCARLRFFLPRDFPKVEGPLAELARVDAFPRAEPLRVLDLGSGLGATALAAARYARRAGLSRRIEVTAVDRDAAALRLGARLAAAFSRREGGDDWLQWSTRDADVGTSRALADDRPHLVLLGFVLNELADGGDGDGWIAAQLELLRRVTDVLAPGGAIVILEPALREQSRRLGRLRQALIDRGTGPHLFAPCLHSGACPLLARERDWCHELLPLALPPPIAQIAREAGLRAADLSYSYLTLTREPRSLAALNTDPGGGDAHAYRIVSSVLRSKGKLELLLCDDGPLSRLRRLDRHRRAGNAVLSELGRGSIARISRATATGSRLEVDPDTHIEVLHGVWRRG